MRFLTLRSPQITLNIITLTVLAVVVAMAAISLWVAFFWSDK